MPDEDVEADDEVEGELPPEPQPVTTATNVRTKKERTSTEALARLRHDG